MKKKIVILFALIFSFMTVSAQDSYVKNRWNFKAGYGNYEGWSVSDRGVKNTFGNYRLEANYGILNFLETGLYVGYSRISSRPVPVIGQGLIYQNQNTPFFGIGLNFHPLTFLIKKPDFRFDLYLLGRYGGIYYSSPEDYIPAKGLKFQNSQGVGLAFYFTKHIGVYTEYSFSGLHVKSGNFRYGLSVKL
ncbi:MAG: hypothetical protein WC699_17470 [Bacteroidales bacterium]|jgi:hypothetical protein